jgi:sarcosine oxidase, subunit beta
VRTSVAVVGGGSTGSSILYHLAKRGITDSTLIEKGPVIASGQTGRSTALVRTHYTVPVVAKMALLSYLFFKRFGEEVPGYTSGYVETGLLIGTTPEADAAVRASMDMFHSMGIRSDFIDKEEVRRLEPMLDASSFSSVVYEPGMGYAEPSTTASSFASAAQDAGARLLTATSVESIAKTPAGYALSTSAGVVEADKVVLATGVWSPSVFRALGIEVPIKPVRHPIAIYGRPEGFRGVRPVVWDFPRSAYYKPEGQVLMQVGSMEAELDATSPPVDPDRYDQGISFDEAEKFSRWAADVYPVMATDGKYERGYSGVYDITPDQQPIIDELSDYGYPGLFCLVGLSGHGFKLSPEFGRMMASLVVDGTFPDYDISVFRLKRFKTGDLLRSRYSLSTVG